MIDLVPQRNGAGKEGSLSYWMIVIAYVVCVSIEAMGVANVFPGKTSLYADILGCVAGTGVGVLVLGVTGRLRQLEFLSRGLFYALLTYTVLTIVVLLLNVVNQSQTNIITRGMGNILYQVLAIFLSFSGAYLFGKRGIHYTFLGFAIAFAVLILTAIRSFGLSTLVSDLISLILLGGTDTHATRTLEAHTYLAGIGYFVYYFFVRIRFRSKGFLRTKESWLSIFYFLAAMAICILGFKRTMLLSSFLSIAEYYEITFVEKKYGDRMARILLMTQTGILVGICVAYIYVIKTGLFYEFVKLVGVDTSGRDRFYKAFEDYYDLSLGYVGKGYGWVNRVADSILHEGTRVESIHNEILQFYIELGASGCIAFFGFFLFAAPWLFGRQYGFEVCKVFACFIPYMLTYSFVANGICNWAISTAQWSIVFSCASEEEEKNLMSFDYS